MNTSLCAILLALIAVPGVFVQSKATLLVTLYFKGVRAGPDGALRAARAGAAPMPAQLAGLSARVVHAQLEGEPQVPVLDVKQESQ